MARFLFNFTRDFAPLVESGAKRQTIRLERKDGRRPAPGFLACCYQGLRTSNSRLLIERPVVRVVDVEMIFLTGSIYINGRCLNKQERLQLAVDDGFTCVADLLAWFKSQYGPDVFRGFLTEWEY